MDQKTNKTLQSFLGVATLFLMILGVVLVVWVVLMYRNTSSAQNYTDTIEVSGSGKVFASPDIARVVFGHRAESDTLETAQADLNTVIGKALETLKEFGIEEKDIIQQSYNAYPRYEYKANCQGVYCVDGNRVLAGYEVAQSIEVVVRSIENSGKILALLADSGVTELSGPYFEIEDSSVYQQEARALAIEDARKEAKILAKNLGVRLGKMVDFYENSYGYPMPYERSLMASDAGEESLPKEIVVPVGEDEISVNVTLVFKIR